MAEAKSKRFTNMVSQMRHGTIIFAVGVALNLVGYYFTQSFRAPFALSTIGTVLSTALGGYFPGVLAGFVTNLVRSVHDYNILSYGFLDMLVALISNLLIKKGFFEKFYKALLTIPVLVFITGVIRYAVSLIIGMKEDGFVVTVLWELVDKSIVAIVVFIALKVLPPEAYINEKTAEYNYVNKGKSRVLSIRGKILIMLSLVCVLIATAITSISYMQYRDEVIQDHIRLGRGAIQLIREKLDPDRVDDFIEHGYMAVGYYSVENYLYDLRDNLPDAEYIYIYKMKHTGILVVFDIDTDEVEADEPGDFIEYEPVMKKYKNDFLAGREIEPTISNDRYGFLLSVYEPIFDRKGNVACYACVDFSMDVLNRYIIEFIIRIVTMFIGFVLLIFAMFIKLMDMNIVSPINAMSYCANSFAYNSEKDRHRNIERIRDLNIRTGDEVENLYNAFRKTVEDSMYFVENLRRAKNQVMTMAEQVTQISVTAYTDSLTGVKNKAAYQKMRQQLEYEIDEGTAKFAIVMVDLNRLKYVNDTYGHEKGDFYIKGSCKMICDLFKHSPVYRFGGDEFVVVLTGDSYDVRGELLEMARNAFLKSGTREGSDPWKRFSAAVGMSEYTGAQNERVDDVFKRADENMYAYKVKMKSNRTE
ncbi:MAG: GGDEF domain-containing protein [Ruminococcus sp.]|uniref:diguanylate cyclase n=1 Tax=Ruminococcus sp. TaxID=41978 RepID=UPI0026008538|nr:diguanylate cyclase [Ruminococcus sp.]MCR5601024.1 GGDEF domain-containing protein [Ruminococcus sp.]